MFNALRKTLGAIAALVAAYWAAHNTRGRIWLTLGSLALVVDAALCYQYGITQTTWHGIGFAVVAIVFSQLPDGAYEEWKKGNTTAATCLGLLCVPLGAVAYQSHIGYGAGIRYGDMKHAMVQQTAYDDARGQVDDNAQNLKLWKGQLAKLNDENGWAATVTADGLRAEMQTADEAIRQETEAGGCAKRCMAKMKTRDEIAAKIAVAEQAKDLTARIEATQRLVDKYRVASANTVAGFSSVEMQTDANTQLFGLIRAAWTGESPEQAMKVTESSSKIANLLITALGSLGFMIMAPIGFFMAGRNRRDFDDAEDIWKRQEKRNTQHSVPANSLTPLASSAGNAMSGFAYPAALAGGHHLREEFTINDHRGVEALKTQLMSNHQRALAILGGA